jgi:uncharacterized membrane protein YqaE (UPF0057 family)
MKRVLFRLMLMFIAFASIAPQSFAASMPVPVTPTPATSPEHPTVKQAIQEFNSLPAKEKKERIKEAKKALKKLKAEKKASKEPIASKGLQILFAILIPPVGVLLHEGEINNRFWISLLLTLLFFIPGMIYALIVVLED